jgi:outer membrane immunogenic protein
MKKTLISAIALIASITPAAAADIPAAAPAAPPVYTPPPVSPAYNWTGFYIGAMGGYGQTNNQSPNLKGGFAGGTIGGNWQIANIVLGAEAEGAWSNIGASQSYLGRGLISTQPNSD